MRSRQFNFKSLAGIVAVVGLIAGASQQAQAAATIVINNLNLPGVGFNEVTPAAPLGGNVGTTLGQQRLIAFTYAANLWGATLTSNQPIIINAQFSALTCTATAAVLGSAGATSVFRDFANAPKAATWYPYALANKISGAYLGTLNAPQISANFNVNLGQSNCLTGTFFYWGLDGNHGTHIDFVAVLQHELAHALGFVTFTNGNTGVQFGGSPSIWDHFLFGTTASKLWKDMTDAERAASAISGDKLVWTGANVNGAVPFVLRPSVTALSISGPRWRQIDNVVSHQDGDRSSVLQVLHLDRVGAGAAVYQSDVASDSQPVDRTQGQAGQVRGPGQGSLRAGRQDLQGPGQLAPARQVQAPR